MVRSFILVLWAISLGTLINLFLPSSSFAATSADQINPSFSTHQDSNDVDCASTASWDDPIFIPFADFAASISISKRDTLVGVYVCNLLALRVDQQPASDPIYVSNQSGTVTQFALAARYGTIGLLAHNTLAGNDFFNLIIGRQVTLVYGDGSIKQYVISDIHHYQTIQPENPYSDFVDLDQMGAMLSSTQLFQQYFATGDRVVFQTCIAKDKNPSWGRLFVTAVPLGAR